MSSASANSPWNLSSIMTRRLGLAIERTRSKISSMKGTAQLLYVSSTIFCLLGARPNYISRMDSRKPMIPSSRLMTKSCPVTFSSFVSISRLEDSGFGIHLNPFSCFFETPTGRSGAAAAAPTRIMKLNKSWNRSERSLGGEQRKEGGPPR